MYYEHYTIGGELYHHGILGQKWGDRNGPPYPLGSGDHSAKEKKDGWRKSLKDSGRYSHVERKKKKKELVVDAMTGELKNDKNLREAATRKFRMEHDYLLKPIIDKIDRKRESEDHLVEMLNNFENIKKKESENFDPWKAMSDIDKTLSKKEKDLLGVGNDESTDDIQFFFDKGKNAYLITADYHGKYKDEHPIPGKIIGIAAKKEVRGTGVTDKLITDAKKHFSSDTLVAEIDEDNIASQKLFERNGFKKVREDDGIKYYTWKNRR